MALRKSFEEMSNVDLLIALSSDDYVEEARRTARSVLSARLSVAESSSFEDFEKAELNRLAELNARCYVCEAPVVLERHAFLLCRRGDRKISLPGMLLTALGVLVVSWAPPWRKPRCDVLS